MSDTGITINDRRGEYAEADPDWRIHEIRAAEWAFVGAGKTPSGVRVTPETALTCEAFIGVIRVISETLAACDLNLIERIPGGGRRLAEDRPLFEVLGCMPNGWQSTMEWVETMTALACMYGTSFALIKPGKRGAIDQLVPLHPSRMSVKRLENDDLLYEYREPGTERLIQYTQGQIFRLPFFSTDSVTGNNPTTLLRNAIGLAQALEQHAGAFFGNGARPGVIFTNDNAMPDEARERAREMWERMHRGADRAYRTAILPQGMKPVEFGQVNNDQAQFLESRQYQIISLARYFRVPPHLVQDLTRATYSNIEQTGIDFVTHCIKPWAKRWAGAIYRDLIAPTLGPAFRAEFDTKWITMGDSAARIAYIRDAIQCGLISHNEGRAMEGLNPVEDNGDVRFMAVNMTTVDRLVEPPEAPPAPGQEGDTFDVQTEPSVDEEGSSGEVDELDASEQVEAIAEGAD